MKTEVLANLKTDSNKNLARSHFFNIHFNTTDFKRTTTPHKILQELDHYHYKLNVRGTSRVVTRLRK